MNYHGHDNHQVDCVAGDLEHLSRHRSRRRPVDCEERRTRACGKQRPQVCHHVRFASNIDTIVEDRVAEQRTW
ncbi:MAG: hypothetical protein H0W18_00515 [Acidobacteria bacterium]|nr:hypothetical protein [Acidobacteriota bacterium]